MSSLEPRDLNILYVVDFILWQQMQINGKNTGDTYYKYQYKVYKEQFKNIDISDICSYLHSLLD